MSHDSRLSEHNTPATTGLMEHSPNWSMFLLFQPSLANTDRSEVPAQISTPPITGLRPESQTRKPGPAKTVFSPKAKIGKRQHQIDGNLEPSMKRSGRKKQKIQMSRPFANPERPPRSDSKCTKAFKEQAESLISQLRAVNWQSNIIG
jgi:hypothetical protein